MKKLVLLVMLFPCLVFAAGETEWQTQNGARVSVAKDTISTQHVIGSYTRVCSLATFTALDSGGIIVMLSGIANLANGQALYVAIDSADAGADGSTDTAYANTYVVAPPVTTETMKIPFLLSYATKADSAGTLVSPVAAMAGRSSTDNIVVENVLLQIYMLSATH